MKKRPNRYVITGIVRNGENKGKKVWIHWSPEGGGWWQWGPEAWAQRFTENHGPRFEDALRTAKGENWTKDTCGPWFDKADVATVAVEEVPAIVVVTVH